MKTNYTDITIILDRSGSMQVIKDDTIGQGKRILFCSRRYRLFGIVIGLQRDLSIKDVK
jgi:hypothetical protein